MAKTTDGVGEPTECRQPAKMAPLILRAAFMMMGGGWWRVVLGLREPRAPLNRVVVQRRRSEQDGDYYND